jgi:hypothetical protein
VDGAKPAPFEIKYPKRDSYELPDKDSVTEVHYAKGEWTIHISVYHTRAGTQIRPASGVKTSDKYVLCRPRLWFRTIGGEICEELIKRLKQEAERKHRG